MKCLARNQLRLETAVKEEKKMSEQEKNRILEENLPSIETIIAEYKKQGKELTESEAGQIRDRIKEDIGAGHLDAMENLISDDNLEAVAGGRVGCIGGVPTPTKTPPVFVKPEGELAYGPGVRPQ